MKRALITAAVLLASCAKGSSKDPYLYTAPPAGTVASAAVWETHLKDDLLPYWLMGEAKGFPVGNFPTYRGMDGTLQSSTDRKPRMMGRQVFTYSAGYMLTGDEALLDLARAGDKWLLDHAVDKARGGWFADLDVNGNPKAGDGDKLSQDMAYDAMGPAAYFFVTRDPDAEAAVLATRDLLFDPKTYWDSTNGRIKDGMNAALTSEAYMGAPGSWELVAQLDPVTAFLLLVQPVLTDPARQTQVLGDLRTLALRLHDSFWKDGIFWGSTGAIGTYNTNHTDFGHILKAYWATLQIDKRLDDRPLQDFVAQHADATLTLAHDDLYGRWAKKPISQTAVSYGSDWWAYAESDQLAATLALHDPKWIPIVAETSQHFREDYVDRTRAAREVVPSLTRVGTWVYGWGDSDTAKCNEWKNGFHSSEHALVMAIYSHWAAGEPAPLYFAFPAAQVQALAQQSRPYTFLGHVASVEDLGALANDPARHKVRVSFDQIR